MVVFVNEAIHNNVFLQTCPIHQKGMIWSDCCNISTQSSHGFVQVLPSDQCSDCKV